MKRRSAGAALCLASAALTLFAGSPAAAGRRVTPAKLDKALKAGAAKLAAGDPAGAQAKFRLILKRASPNDAPRRALARLGYGRAFMAQGLRFAARLEFQEVLRLRTAPGKVKAQARKLLASLPAHATVRLMDQPFVSPPPRPGHPLAGAARLVDGNALIALGEKAGEAMRRAADGLSRATGHAVVSEKSVRLSYTHGTTVILVGTDKDSALLAKFFASGRWGKGAVPKVTSFAPSCSRGERPLVVIGGASEAAVIRELNRLAAEAPDRAPKPAPVDVWFADPLYMTLPQETNREPERRRLNWQGARGEKLWRKLVIRLAEATPTAKITVAPWTGPKELGPPKLYLLARRKAWDVAVDDVMVPLRGTPDLIKDPPRQEAACLMIEYQVPPDAPAGDYKSTVTVEAGGRTHSAAMALHVYDFAVPDVAPLRVFFFGGIAPYEVEALFRTQTDEQYQHALRSIARTFRKFGANVCPRTSYLAHVKWILGKGDTIRFDYVPLEQYVRVMGEEGLGGPYILGANPRRPRRGRLWGGHGRFGVYDEKGTHYDYRRNNGGPGPYVGLARWHRIKRGKPDWLGDLRRHLRETGRLGQTYIYCGDEPGDAGKWLASLKPLLDKGFRPITSINKLEPAFLRAVQGALDRWILLDHLWVNWRFGDVPRFALVQDFVDRRCAAGQPVWWYDCFGLLTPRLAPARARRLGWNAWRWGVDGVGFWSPFSPYSVVARLNKDRSKRPKPLSRATWDDFHVSSMAFYNDAERHEMLGSRRMVCMALGWEDYKYLWTLDRLTAKLPKRSPERAKVRDALNQAWRDASRSDFAAARRRLAEAIEPLYRRHGHEVRKAVRE